MAAIDLPFLAVGWLATLIMAVGKGAFGGGLAIVAVPLLSIVIDPLEAAIAAAPLIALMDGFALGAFGRGSRSWEDLAWLIPGMVVGVGIGVAVFATVDPRWVALLIASVTLTFAAHFFLWGRRTLDQGRPVSRPLALLAGTASGFTTFVAHAGGPPVTMYLLRRGLPKHVFAGTAVAFFVVGNLLKLPPYLILGWDRPTVLLGALALSPAVPLGVWIGRRLNDRLPQRTLYVWCYVLLSAASAKLFVDAVRSLMG